MTFDTIQSKSMGLIALLAAQCLCVVFFVGDIVADMRANDALPHVSVESLTATVLAITVAFEIRLFLRLLQRQAHLQRAASLAARAMSDIIDALFDEWRLTPSERDVANFLVKGLSISDIAAARGSAEGTVKSQLNAIYRKSGSQNRGELLAQIIDCVMENDTQPAAR